jgi:hypothetical protein
LITLKIIINKGFFARKGLCCFDQIMQIDVATCRGLGFDKKANRPSENNVTNK